MGQSKCQLRQHDCEHAIAEPLDTAKTSLDLRKAFHEIRYFGISHRHVVHCYIV